MTDAQKSKTRKNVHLVFAAIFLVLVLVFRWINNPSMIGVILKVAAYTYGPLLGLFSFGLLTKRIVNGKWVPYICVAAPAISYLVDLNQKTLFGGYEIGLELLIINGLLTYIGLLLISKRASNTGSFAAERTF